MKKIIAIFISIMILGCICGCRKTPNENFSNTSSMSYNSSVDSSMFEDFFNSATTQTIETSADETTLKLQLLHRQKTLPLLLYLLTKQLRNNQHLPLQLSLRLKILILTHLKNPLNRVLQQLMK